MNMPFLLLFTIVTATVAMPLYGAMAPPPIKVDSPKSFREMAEAGVRLKRAHGHLSVGYDVTSLPKFTSRFEATVVIADPSTGKTFAEVRLPPLDISRKSHPIRFIETDFSLSPDSKIDLVVKVVIYGNRSVQSIFHVSIKAFLGLNEGMKEFLEEGAPKTKLASEEQAEKESKSEKVSGAEQ